MARFQQTLASQASFEKHGRKSKRELFLDQMNQVVPWSELLSLVEPFYPKAGNGRQPVGVAIMLRTYFLQQWFGLSDPGMEEAFYDRQCCAALPEWIWAWPRRRTRRPSFASPLARRARSVRRDAGRGEPLPGEQGHSHQHGHHRGRDDYSCASSTKNSSGKRDPEMHQTKKGNQWYFGAKAHIGVDSKETVVHSVATTAASVADKHMLPDLLHGKEKKVWGDAGYQGQTEAIRAAAPKAQDMTSRRTKYKNYVDEEAKRKNTTKARVRAKVEWPFRILKRVFGFTKVRYRGIWKNHQWLCAAFALVNLYQHRNRWPLKGRSVSGGRKTASRDQKGQRQLAFSDRKLIQNQESSEVASPLQNHALAQSFLRATLTEVSALSNNSGKKHRCTTPKGFQPESLYYGFSARRVHTHWGHFLRWPFRAWSSGFLPGREEREFDSFRSVERLGPSLKNRY